MRIHTTLAFRDLSNHAGMPDDVNIHVLSKHRSQSHSQAFEVALRGVGDRHRRPPNTRDESLTGKAATYDDWGQYLAVLYRKDPTIKAGPYNGKADFERQTKHKYV